MFRRNKLLKSLGFLLFTAFIAGVLRPGEGSAQGNLYSGDGLEYYYRILQVSGLSDETSSFTLRPVQPDTDLTTDQHPWRQHVYGDTDAKNYLPGNIGKLHFHEPVLFQSVNSALPRGNNDGAIWQGKGYNTAFTAGVEASLGPLYIQFRPVMGMAQNREFDLGPYNIPTVRTPQGRVAGSEYAYRDFMGRVDYVQRFGDETYSWFNLGDSSVELRYWGVRLALSNQRIWTGPAVNTSLQYGYSAPGLRHVNFGTYRPLQTPVGDFEFSYIFGGQQKSDYFDRDDIRERLQSIHSLVFIYSPGFVPGLSVGAVRTFMLPYPDSFENFKNQTLKLFESTVRAGLDNGGPDPDNQVASGFARWVHPDAGLDVYFEYGRNDHNIDLRDFRLQPNHHRAYTLGMIKTFDLPLNRLLSVGVEINQLEAMRTVITRGDNYMGGWYMHANQVLGFTNRGQILGTGYGPGVNMQMIRGDLFDPRGSLSFKFARITYHNSRTDQFFNRIQAANEKEVTRTDVRNIELMAGAEVTAFLNYGIELSAALEQSFILNHHNLSGNDVTNTRLELVLRKQIRGWKR